MSRRASWAAGRRSTGSSRTAVRRPTTTSGRARGATGWNWDNVLPYFKKVERDMDFDGPWHGREGRIPVRRIFPDLWPEHAKAVGEGVRAGGLQVHPGSECRVGGRVFSDHHLQRLRTAGVGGDRLSRSRHADARESDHLHRHPGRRTDLRGPALRRRQGDGRRQAGGVSRPGNHPVVRRHPFPGASDAGRDRAGRASAGAWDRGASGAAGGRAAAAGSSGGRGRGLHQAARADHPRLHAAAYLHGAALLLEPAGHPGRATCSRW